MKKAKKNIRLWRLLTLVFISVLLVVTTLLYSLILYQHARSVRETEERHLLEIGEQLAREPLVKEALLAGSSNQELEDYTVELAAIYHLDFVVIMDMNAIRLTHPNAELIGQHFEGGDEQAALQGETLISVSEGTLGQSLRGFVPVYLEDDANQQIGVAALGLKVSSLSSLIKDSRKGYSIALFVSIALSSAAASGLAFYLKRQLHNLEPQEISRLFEERNAMLDYTKDAIVVIDTNATIQHSNIAAEQLYHKISGSQNLVGQPLNKLILDMENLSLTQTQEQIYRQDGQDYLFSAAPIVVHQNKIGSILFLRNATDSFFVMDQLANTTAYASALQTQSHEFMNKLHVIYGLADLQAYTELKIYLDAILTPEKEFSQRLSYLVKNPQFAGFLIGEREKFAEKKVSLKIEILSELAMDDTTEETNTLLTLYRYIHHCLLRFSLLDDIQMTLSSENNLLTSSYSLALSPQQLIQLKECLAANFFQQLLESGQAKITLQSQQDLITLELIFPYHEVIR